MIRRLALFNVGPYRGTHVIELGSKAYAITARFESDPGRSNTGGKSFLLEMVNFAITGKLAKFRRYDADGWITKGEREGSVLLELEDGRTIVRSRVRGQPTQVRFGGPDKGKGAAQEDASIAVLEHLGFEADDFPNIAYFEQKQMARLVLTEPEKRMEIVRGWLGLGKCEEAEEKVGSIAAESAAELEKMRAQRDALAGSMGEPPPAFDYAAAVTRRQAVRDELRELDAEWKRGHELAEKARAYQKILADYAALVTEGKALAAEVAKLAPLADIELAMTTAEARWEEKRSAYGAAGRDVAAKRRVSLGQFDGRCPVASIACPATEQINTDRTASAKAFREANTEQERLGREMGQSEADKREAKLAWVEASSSHQRLEQLREKALRAEVEVKEARAWLKSYEPASGEDELEARRSALHEEQDKLSTELTYATTASEIRQKQEAKLTELGSAIDREQRDFAIASRARSVFRATQRRLAERALERINGQASAMLAEGNIPLAVELRWEREGKDPAKQCEDCGAAFPKSARVKLCSRCGATRGLQVVQKLEFLPSDRSGAADDIAGVVLQLAAGAWFLRSRQSPWATAMLDEPLGSCDRTNRRALSMQLVKLLSTGTWRQALLISHSPDTVELYPGRIEIVVGRDGSRRIEQT